MLERCRQQHDRAEILGAPLLGLSPLLGIAGVFIGFGTFMGLRKWSNARRRQQFLTSSLPRAYLPERV